MRQILAQELGPATNLSVTVNVTVYIDDVNDNPPVFDEEMYIVELPENMTAGTRVVQVYIYPSILPNFFTNHQLQINTVFSLYIQGSCNGCGYWNRWNCAI